MIKIAIVGASGLVGQNIIKILKEEGIIQNAKLTLFVSDKSHGKVLMVDGKEFRLCSLTEKALNQNFDIVFFSAGDNVSLEWAKKFAAKGSFVIDNSNAFRRQEEVPLVVPEINFSEVLKKTRIISNPNCSTIQLAVVIDKLLEVSNIDKVVVSTYQSVSGAGREALQELLFPNVKSTAPKIKDNVVAAIGDVLDSGFTVEEDKIMFELNKILSTNLSVCATAVRVPIPYCHSESVYVKFGSSIDIDQIKRKLDCDYIKVEDGLSFPTEIADTNITHVCRIRRFSKNEILLFVVADNLRRGAAYNAVMIAKYIIQNFI